MEKKMQDIQKLDEQAKAQLVNQRLIEIDIEPGYVYLKFQNGGELCVTLFDYECLVVSLGDEEIDITAGSHR